MTETAPEQVNGHAEPKVSILKLAPEQEPGPPPPVTPPTSKDAPVRQRRVRIDSLRRVVVETRSNPVYRFTVRHGCTSLAGPASSPAAPGTRGRPPGTMREAREADLCDRGKQETSLSASPLPPPSPA